MITRFGLMGGLVGLSSHNVSTDVKTDFYIFFRKRKGNKQKTFNQTYKLKSNFSNTNFQK